MALWKRGRNWWADATVNGQRYRESLKTTDRREARNREKELVKRIQDGKVGSPCGQGLRSARLLAGRRDLPGRAGQASRRAHLAVREGAVGALAAAVQESPPEQDHA